jgi:hypothetical protein
MAMVTHDALGGQNRAEGTCQCLGRVWRKRGQGGRGFHRLREIRHKLAGCLRICQEVGDIVTTGAEPNNRVEGDWH